MTKLFAALTFFVFTLTASAQSVEPSGKILSAAYKQAAKENKNVIVIFHASWCGWCKKMDAAMNDETTKKYFDDNYVTVHLTVQENPAHKKDENPGADVFLAKYKGTEAGLPFFVIMDKKGKLIGDSFVNGSNIGCPASASEVEAFTLLLKKSSSINNAGMDAITKRFRQNEAR